MAGWIRVEADIHRHPKVVALPSPAARWAFLVTLAEGKAVEGRWASVAHYRACVPPQEARHLSAMISAGLVAMDGPAVVIHDWDDYQMGGKDATAAERMRRFRERARNGDTSRTATASLRRNGNAGNENVTLPPFPPPHPPLYPPGTETGTGTGTTARNDRDDRDEPYQVAIPPEADPLRLLAEELTGQPNVLANVWSGLGEKAVRLARKHGLPAVEREWRRIAAEEGGMPEIRQLVFGADEALNRIRRTAAVTESAEERDARELAELKALAARNIAAGATR